MDWENNGQPNADASGDGADEDGIGFVDPLVAGQTCVHRCLSRIPAVACWISSLTLMHSGGFGNNANEVFSAVLTGGTKAISLDVPADAVVGTTFARFRLSSAGGLAATGAATDGEVEDYTVECTAPARRAISVTHRIPIYGTLRADFGPSHVIGGPYLGIAVDAESDGQGNAVATGDGRDDDGVHFGDLMIAGQSANIEVTSSPGGGVLDYFVDFNANGLFGDDAVRSLPGHAHRRHGNNPDQRAVGCGRGHHVCAVPH